MHVSVRYSVGGRRGPKPTAVFNMIHVFDPAALLTALLGVGVTIDEPAVMWATQEVRVQSLPGQSPELVTISLPPEQHWEITMFPNQLREMTDTESG